MKFAIAMLVVALAAALAAPAARQAAIERRAAAVAADLRQFANAFQAYAHKHGDWPASSGTPAEIPAGMQEPLSGTKWPAATPIGGGYRWVRHSVQRGERFEAAILIVPTENGKVSDDEDLLLAIDRQVDDGKLGTGKLRLGYRNLPVFVIEH